MQSEVVLIAGLPGSGKTSYLCQLLRDHWLIFDDLKREAFDHCSKFRNSRKLRALVAALQDGLKCAVADIDFCDTHARDEGESTLRSEIQGLDIRWEYFANDRTACEANVRARNGSCLQRELDLLARYSPSYHIPDGAVVLPVWRKHEN